MLAQHEIPAYLLRQDLVLPECIVRGDFTVVDASRRNQNFKVVSEHGANYQLKQGGTGAHLDTVAREATVYHLLHSSPASTPLRHYLPAVHRFDPAERLLVIELIKGAEDLREYHARRGYFPVTLASRMGTALSCLHRLTTSTVPQLDRESFQSSAPWVFDLTLPRLQLFREISQANLGLIRIIQSAADLRQMLVALREEWRADTLIHNDAKWENWLVFSPATSQRRTRLKIIDWEFAGLGDPCWDLGTIFSSYLSFWLMSIPVTGESPPERFMELSPYRLRDMQAAIRGYWLAYVRGMELDASTADQWLLRAVRYAAARLIQTAFEHLQAAVQVNVNTVCLVQLSRNILHRPREAAAHLLGIHPQRAWSSP